MKPWHPVLFLALFCAGCIASYGVPRTNPFRANLGQPVKLRRAMLLVERGNALGGFNGTRSLFHARYGLVERDSTMPRGRAFAELSVGTTVTIDYIRDEITGDNNTIIAYGHTRDPIKGGEASFAYDCTYVNHVPWTPDTQIR